MRIAQVSPLYEAVPPKLYGGTERVVHFLTEELVSQGHDVTLFASADSQTSARLVSHIDHALRLADCADPLAHHIVQLQEVLERATQFDIIHFHTDYLHFPFTHSFATHITTLHGRLDIPDLQYVYNKFHHPVISISADQRKPLPQARWAGVVYHGLPLNLFRKGSGNGGYLAFLGRISPEKGPEEAIAIAKRAGIKLKLAAKIDKADAAYFKERIEPLLHHPLIEFIGEINEVQKQAFLGDAMALLFPINWCEPFGMVMIEAMACGTPVIAFAKGSVPEIIHHGVSGFMAGNIEQAAEAVRHIDRLPRDEVRTYFEKRFTAERMASDYLRIYRQVIRQKHLSESLESQWAYKGATKEWSYITKSLTQ